MKMSYTKALAFLDEVEGLAKKYNLCIKVSQQKLEPGLISKEEQQKSIEITRRAGYIISIKEFKDRTVDVDLSVDSNSLVIEVG